MKNEHVAVHKLPGDGAANSVGDAKDQTSTCLAIPVLKTI